MKITPLTFFGIFLGLILSASEPKAPNLELPDEAAIRQTLYVDQGARRSGSGTRAAPFQSIGEALQSARRSALPTRISIAAGDYRETLDISGTGAGGDPLIILEAEEKGQVTILGSDILTDWKAVAGHPYRYTHPWSLGRGWEANPWPGLMPLETPGLRNELVFRNNSPLRQVYEESALKANTYYVDDEGQRLFVQLPLGQDIRSLTIEASVRPVPRQGKDSKLLRVFQRDNLVLRGLTFRHAATTSFAGAVQILASRNILIEDCLFEWNSGWGLSITQNAGRRSENIVVRRSSSLNNGFSGMGGDFQNALLEDITITGNNWRGAEVGATGWAPAGWKFSGLDRVILRRFLVVANHASGGWLDDNIYNVLIEDFVSMNNLRAGLSVEAIDGPVLLRRAFLAGNSTGINLFDSRNLTVVDSIAVDNTLSQIRLAGSTVMDPEALARIQPDWRRERLRKRQSPSDITLKNVMIGISGEIEAARDGMLITVGVRESRFFAADGSLTLQPLVDTFQAEGLVLGHPRNRNARVFHDLTARPIQVSDWERLVKQPMRFEFSNDRIRSAVKARLSSIGIEIEPYDGSHLPTASSVADSLEL
jgi:hypothetical protein